MIEHEKKRIFSGIKPTGELNIGHYIGALRNWSALSAEYDNYYCVVDMHSLTIRNDPDDLRRRTLELLAQYIACGLDPDKCALFIQSHVAEHAELAWILGCYAMFGELSRMTQFKDMSERNPENINGGLFTYPVLMAADILLYNADLVPVGDDQKQHVELTRDIAARFNGVYGDTFIIPEVHTPKVGARIMSLSDPTSKMSKSVDDPGGTVLIMDEPDAVLKKFKRAVTDSDSESPVRYDPQNKKGVANLMTIYAACTGKSYAQIEAEFSGQGYGRFKPMVGEAAVELLRPIRERAAQLVAERAYLEDVYREGARKARETAAPLLGEVKRKVGLIAG